MKQPIRRKPVQIAVASSTGDLIALCDDGSIWALFIGSLKPVWKELPPVPTGVDGDLKGFDLEEADDE